MAFRKTGNGRFGGRMVSRPQRRDERGYRGAPSGFGGGRPSGRSFDGRDRPQRSSLELFDAVCASCGKETQVPFKPIGNKPVYCRDCFKKDETPRRGAAPGSSAAPEDLSAKLDELNEKLDKILEAMSLD